MKKTTRLNGRFAFQPEVRKIFLSHCYKALDSWRSCICPTRRDVHSLIIWTVLSSCFGAIRL